MSDSRCVLEEKQTLLLGSLESKCQKGAKISCTNNVDHEALY